MEEYVMINEHEKIEMLLPWFVNGQLDDEETAQVNAHLLACPECQLLLGHEYKLKSEIASMPAAVPQFAAPAVIESRRPPFVAHAWQSTRQAVSTWTAKPMRVAVFATAQAAMLLIAFQLGQPAAEPGSVYRTLSSGDAASAANALVMFNPDTRESDFRAILTGANATIVGGPTESNAYYLHIEPTVRDTRLESMRGNTHIVLAQPIDGE